MKIPILLITHDRPYLLDKVLNRLIKYTDWKEFELWICSNASTNANDKIIKAYAKRYKEINVFYQDVNQISLIQNNLINKLRAEIYIKLDDDILVSENWYKGFIGLIERHGKDMSIGSVVIPINGFGWLPFLEIMGYIEDFKSKFPEIELIQGCMEPASWYSKDVNKYLWEKSLNIDDVAKQFTTKQKSIRDLEVPFRYSIGAIVFYHDFWQKMNGWKVHPLFKRNEQIYKALSLINHSIAKIRGRKEQRKVQEIIKILSGMTRSALGTEEEYLFEFSTKNGYKQFVTTESIVFHFAFGPTEDYLMKNIYLDIKF